MAAEGQEKRFRHILSQLLDIELYTASLFRLSHRLTIDFSKGLLKKLMLFCDKLLIELLFYLNRWKGYSTEEDVYKMG